MTREIAVSDKFNVLVVYPDKYVEGTAIWIDDVPVFELLESGRWQFNPKELLIEACDRDVAFFYVPLTALRKILLGEPFYLSLNGCNGCGNCCSVPPFLTLEEANKIIVNYGMGVIDTSSGFIMFAKRYNRLNKKGYCWFFDTEERKCLLHSTDFKPENCQWYFCGASILINNVQDIYAYVRSVLRPAPKILLQNII